MIFTFLRGFLILAAPILMLVLAYVFKLKLTKNILILISLLIIGLIINLLLYDSYILNNLLSILILYLSVIILLSKPTNHYLSIESWMQLSSSVLGFVNITALINFIYVYVTGIGLLDDGFNGLYGRSGLSIHTLSLVNYIYGLYYITKYKYKKSVFFFFSAFMCFYGLGLLIFLGSIGLVFITNLKKKYIKFIFILPLTIWLVIYTAMLFNPNAFSYMEKNLKRVQNTISNKKPYDSELADVKKFKTVKTPRKIMAFEGGARVLSHPILFVFGTSPGTYNSRVSFLLNGEYTRNKLFKKTENRPFYADRDIYPLWNKNITFQYNDGTRNEPFSSILALMVEYGILQVLLIFYLFRSSYKRVKERNYEYKFFLQFLFFFFLLNLLTENYLEYPEFMILIIILYKSLESSNVKAI